jgi:transposase-like protein
MESYRPTLSRAPTVVIAVGVKGETGEREVLGLDVGPSENGAFWTAFLRSLVARGLSGVRLVTSDAHRGLESAIGVVLQGASWQRCRVHFMRNALSLVPKAAQQMVGATIRTVFAQPDAASAHEQWRRVSDGFRPRFPRLACLMDEAEEELERATDRVERPEGEELHPRERERLSAMLTCSDALSNAIVARLDHDSPKRYGYAKQMAILG